MKGNLQQIPLSNATVLCSHSQPSQDWPSHHCASEKQPTKANHLSVASFEYEIFSLFMYHSVHDETSNLLTWAGWESTLNMILLRSVFWDTFYHLCCQHCVELSMFNHSVSKSQCRKLLNDAAGISISSSREIFLARDCPETKYSFLIFFAYNFLTTPTFGICHMWSRESEDTPHLMFVHVCMLVFIINDGFSLLRLGHKY